jgi:hypothetical protein
MSRTSGLSVTFPALLAACSTADAGEQAYVCTVEHVYSVSDYAKLTESVLHNELEGARFAVSRQDGKILGEVLATPTAVSTRVIDSGSGSDSFKAVADFGDVFQSLEVQEFRTGEKKPFVAVAMGGVGIVTGFCR